MAARHKEVALTYQGGSLHSLMVKHAKINPALLLLLLSSMLRLKLFNLGESRDCCHVISRTATAASGSLYNICNSQCAPTMCQDSLLRNKTQPASINLSSEAASVFKMSAASSIFSIHLALSTIARPREGFLPDRCTYCHSRSVDPALTPTSAILI